MSAIQIQSGASSHLQSQMGKTTDMGVGGGGDALAFEGGLVSALTGGIVGPDAQIFGGALPGIVKEQNFGLAGVQGAKGNFLGFNLLSGMGGDTAFGGGNTVSSASGASSGAAASSGGGEGNHVFETTQRAAGPLPGKAGPVQGASHGDYISPDLGRGAVQSRGDLSMGA